MFLREQVQLWQQSILKCLMLLNSCANTAVEAEAHFKSVKMLNYMITHNTARRYQLPSLLPGTAQSDDRNHVPGFPSALHFSSTHSCDIHSKRHPVSYHGLQCSPARIKHRRKENLQNKPQEEGGSTSHSGSPWSYWPDQQGSGWQVLQPLFSLQMLLAQQCLTE